MPRLSQDHICQFLESVELFNCVSRFDLAQLSNKLIQTNLKKGEHLFRTGDDGRSLFLVVDGELDVVTEDFQGRVHRVATIGPGECVGEIALFTSEKRSATVSAGQDSRLLELSKGNFDKALGRNRNLRKLIAKLILQRLRGLHLLSGGLFHGLNDELLNEIESHFFWKSLRRGEILFRQGDPADALYLVVHGRLQVYMEKSKDKSSVTSEIGRGQPVGAVALLVDEPRSATVRALRDTDLIGLANEGFAELVEQNPKVILPLVRILVKRLLKTTAGKRPRHVPRTVAVVPLIPEASRMIRKLVRELSQSESILYLNAQRFNAIHGFGAAEVPSDAPNALYLRQWLNRQEEDHAHIFYETDAQMSAWSRRCLRQADRILIVARAEDDPAITALENSLRVEASLVPQELILLHEHNDSLPKNTFKWLKPRQLVRHHHLRLNHPRDLKRLARFISGKAVGVVLGSGGARGLAHLGVLQALKETHTPIDFIGGSSMGALVASLAAAGFSRKLMLEAIKSILLSRPRGYGYTVPLVSMMKVDGSEERLKLLFADRNIEDLWLNFFCISTNLTRATMVNHQRGSVWKAVRASMSIPGLLPPVVEKGELLVDGALLNNVPVDVMTKNCPGPVVACDVSSTAALKIDHSLKRYPQSRQILWSQFSPWASTISAPGIATIMMRSLDCHAAVSKQRRIEEAQLYLTPPVEKYGLLEFNRIDDIIETGYRYTMDVLEKTDMSVFGV
jgi:NTE family protein/lysophospholipid hydrolase